MSLDVAEGEAADGRRPLGVEQDEQPGDAVVGLEACRRGAAVVPGPSGPRCRWRRSGRPIGWPGSPGWSASCFFAQRTKCPASRRWVG